MRKRRAAADFAFMRALDANATARMELEASKVAAHRIQALYPESEFEAIAAQLIERLPDLPSAKFINGYEDCLMPKGWVIRLTREAKIKGSPDFNTFDLPDEDARDDLRRAIELHVTMDSTIKTEDANDFLQASASTTIADACWWAWWIMGRRDQLSRELGVKADELMLTIGKLFKLR